MVSSLAGDIVILSSSGGMYGIAGVPGARIFCLGAKFKPPSGHLYHRRRDYILLHNALLRCIRYRAVWLCIHSKGIKGSNTDHDKRIMPTNH